MFKEQNIEYCKVCKKETIYNMCDYNKDSIVYCCEICGNKYKNHLNTKETVMI